MRSVDRIYLQYSVDEDAATLLINWQEKIAAANSGARLVPKEQLHLTILHFGVAWEVYNEIKMQQPELDWDSFEQALVIFLHQAQYMLPASTLVKSQRLTYMGQNANTAAVAVTTSKELHQAHEQALHALHVFLRSCGITHPQGFMQGSPNFRFALTFRPHITLARLAPQQPSIEMEEVSRAHPFKLTAMKVLYSHAG